MTAPAPIAEELLTESQAVARIPGRDALLRSGLGRTAEAPLPAVARPQRVYRRIRR